MPTLATPEIITSALVLDYAMDSVDRRLNGIFWNTPPRIVFDKDCRYDIEFSVIEAKLPTLDGRKVAGGIDRVITNIFGEISAIVGHQDVFALGPNLHTLVFRFIELPDYGSKPFAMAGNAASHRLQVCLAVIDNTLMVKYGVDRMSRERHRIQGFVDVP